MQSLRPYLGTEITWTPEYVTVEGREVLVVEIGPPKSGDPIHFLLKDLFITKTVNTASGPVTKQHGYHHGTILIRRPGDTERADHHERQMLLRRARATGTRLHARVVADRPEIEAAPALEECWPGSPKVNASACWPPVTSRPPTSTSGNRAACCRLPPTVR
ncbi:hypothetical protein [Actinomadura terrae]|uniref:hypothetical protein n=1 Tax=Actinomadura terrae TaxID=604353 RepID=UPI001FA6C423|nr:hypothetical protein [Actinomadura terrae]